MSQMIKNITMACLLLAAGMLALAGCGDSAPNTKAAIDEGTGRHQADWLPVGHKAAALQDQSACAECHGSDFQGGISRVSCDRCHLGGAASKHPQDWIQDQTTVWSRHAAYIGSSGLTGCANATCHGPDLGGVAQSGPSCTSCHLDGVDSMHPRAWGEHAAFLHGDYTLANGGAKCANAACHGQTLTGVAESGPACTVCHATPPHEVTDQRTAGCSNCHTGETKKLFHPWAAPTALNHAVNADTEAKRASCAVAACHGTALTGGANANCPSCTSCHLGGVSSAHPASFGTGTAIILEHQNYVVANGTAGCANAACHGPNLTAGPGAAGPSCTTCHVGGVITISKHPFAAPAVVNHKAYLASLTIPNDTSSCATAACHGTDLAGGVAGPSCSNCHLGGAAAKHPSSFGTTTTQVALNHKAFVDANTPDGCRNGYCHGSSLNGAAPALGPSCSTTACHQSGIPVGALAANCASCHNRPPAGTTPPNRNGAHAVHNAFTGVTNVCDTCHTGAGTGTANHFSGAADVAFLSTYNANSGAAARNPNGTCSNVSCHGGQTTPVWLTSAIDVSTECTKCHEAGASVGTPQNNSYYSGRHTSHTTTHGIPCFGCHDPVKLAPNHFTSLGTAAMEGPASGTIGGLLITSYNPETKSCNAACHPGARSWLP